jgi:hypothetical protein
MLITTHSVVIDNSNIVFSGYDDKNEYDTKECKEIIFDNNTSIVLPNITKIKLADNSIKPVIDLKEGDLLLYEKSQPIEFGYTSNQNLWKFIGSCLVAKEIPTKLMFPSKEYFNNAVESFKKYTDETLKIYSNVNTIVMSDELHKMIKGGVNSIYTLLTSSLNDRMSFISGLFLDNHKVAIGNNHDINLILDILYISGIDVGIIQTESKTTIFKLDLSHVETLSSEIAEINATKEDCLKIPHNKYNIRGFEIQ